MTKPKVCVLKTDGTNCDRETVFAFSAAGAEAETVHINSLIKGYDPVAKKPSKLEDYHILAMPGGFSHGDYVASGKIFASELGHFLGEELAKFVKDGKPIIGICNGFQVLVKYGLLPHLDGETKQTATLTYNDNGRFNDRWVKLVQPTDSTRCIWTRGIEEIDLPIAHGEGKFVAPPEIIKKLFTDGLVALQYAEPDSMATMEFPHNPNGSLEGIAAICDPTGLIFGLMPHPERYNNPNNHALAPLQKILGRDYINRNDPSVAERLKQVGLLPKEGAGLQIIRNGVEYALKNLVR